MAHVDVVSDILKEAMEAFPSSNFLQSLAHQYLVRGWLSKKQLQGLYDKAAKAESASPAKLATLQVQIKKMPTKYRSEKPEIKGEIVQDNGIEKMLTEILEKYPQHKRVLFLQSKWAHDKTITPAERTDLEKLYKLLVK